MKLHVAKQDIPEHKVLSEVLLRLNRFRLSLATFLEWSQTFLKEMPKEKLNNYPVCV
jgi:hypothetical protein